MSSIDETVIEKCIIPYLDLRDLRKFSLINKHFNKICVQNMNDYKNKMIDYKTRYYHIKRSKLYLPSRVAKHIKMI
jgi:hypothetical protein